MPRYDYRCRECDYQEQVTHSIKTKLVDCSSCGGKGTLYRLISSFSTTGLTNASKENKDQPGKIVKEFIKNAKQEVGEYKNDITRDVINIEDVSE